MTGQQRNKTTKNKIKQNKTKPKKNKNERKKNDKKKRYLGFIFCLVFCNCCLLFVLLLFVCDIYIYIYKIASVPPEWILEQSSIQYDTSNMILYIMFCIPFGSFLIPPYCCCAPCRRDDFHYDSEYEACCNCSTIYPYASARIGATLIELIIICLVGISNSKHEYFEIDFIDNLSIINDDDLLFHFDGCLIIYCFTIICFGIYTQFPHFMPDFLLPDNIPVYSKWGYSYLGKITELKRIKQPDVDQNRQDFWNEFYGNTQQTCLRLAKQSGHLDTTAWLEAQGATR